MSARHRWGKEEIKRFHWKCKVCGLVKHAQMFNHVAYKKDGKVVSTRFAPPCEVQP